MVVATVVVVTGFVVVVTDVVVVGGLVVVVVTGTVVVVTGLVVVVATVVVVVSGLVVVTGTVVVTTGVVVLLAVGGLVATEFVGPVPLPVLAELPVTPQPARGPGVYGWAQRPSSRAPKKLFPPGPPWPSPPAQASPVVHHMPATRTSDAAAQRRWCLFQVIPAAATSPPAPLPQRLPATCPVTSAPVDGA